MDNDLIVLSSSRAIRHEQLQQKESSLFLPHYITMGEFISKLCIVPEYKHIDDDSRILLLLQASDFHEFSKLQIERNFFTFTKNSSYIFKFFEELSAEEYNIANLTNADVYAEYDEHITILQELYKRYKSICDEQKVLDKIFLPHLYKFNEGFVKKFESVTISLDGYLTNFELTLLKQVAKFTTLKVSFISSSFNTKMQEKFLEFGFALEKDYKYLLNLSNGSIEEVKELRSIQNISCESFSEDILQIAYIQKKVYEFIAKGYDPHKIAVILPKESKARVLKIFDTKSNFNFAMGSSFKETSFYKLLDANVKMFDQDSQENIHRSNRHGTEVSQILKKLYGSDELTVMQECFEELREFCTNKTELHIYDKELYTFLKLLPFMKTMASKSIFNLFMQRLAKTTVDDVRGGKITVMGVLESRGVEFDGVIVVDFNEGIVPKKSDKDMFLNTSIREFAGLPTMNDRENLQKHYYNMLFLNAKEVAISYLNSAENNPSRFLKQLSIKENNRFCEQEYANILFGKTDQSLFDQGEFTIPYSFIGEKVSNTKLKTYLTCKKRFYLSYVLKLNEHQIPKDIPKEHEIGEQVHKALCNLYANVDHYSDQKQLQKDLEKELDALDNKNEFVRYQIALQKKMLQKFSATEIDRFREGIRVLKREEGIELAYDDLILHGVIDRIDTSEEGISVLDYKTGSYTLYNKNNVSEANDFQLEFYYLLASKFGAVKQCAFYDLKEGKVVEELFLEEKLALLQAHFKDLQMVEDLEVAMCEDTKHCKYCPYKIMCGRE